MKYAKYEVIKEFEVSSGKAAPWFGEKGGTIQHQTDISVGELVENGFLREID
jgi:Tuberculosis necrotizing toxin